MAREKLSVGPNLFQGKVGGVTLSGKTHSLSA